MEWKEYPDMPDWCDHDKRITLLMPDGREVAGILEIEEQWTGEDEIPFPNVITDNGETVSFFDAVKYKLD